MHAEVTVVFVQSLQGGDIRCSFYYLIHPFDSSHHLITFFLSENRRALVLGNLRYKNIRDELVSTGILATIVIVT